jgi:hypothetical protein
LRGGGEGDLDFLVAKVNEHLEVFPFLVAVHRVDEGLVPVSQAGFEPSGGFVEGATGPLAVGDVEWFEGAVFLGRVFEPGEEVLV